MGAYFEIAEKKFGRLTALHFVRRDKSRSLWLFECECGRTITAAKGHVVSGHTRSCGCLLREALRRRNTLHGKSRQDSRFYKAWRHMRYRCNNPRAKEYVYYGGRGIGIASEWSDFGQFFNDMYQAYVEHVREYGTKNTSLDRIDVNADYSKENCRWATWQEQSRNRRPYGRKTILAELGMVE